jgi:hypothetical protein
MASCGTAVQRGLWPPVALQSSASHGLLWHCSPARAMASCGSAAMAMASSFTRFLDHTQRRDTVGRPHLCEWSARRRNLYLTTHNTHNRQTSMPPVGFDCSRRAAVDLHLRPRGHWDQYIFNPLPPNDIYIYVCVCLCVCVCVSYRTANLKILHFKYLFNKYPYWIF